jgi:molecular chaperone DnaK
MSRIVGIDLGTTNSLVAAVDSGIPVVIADAEGCRLTPSVVHFPANGGAPVVGRKANHVRLLKPAETVFSIKRFMGRRMSEISNEEKSVPYLLCSENGAAAVDLNGRRLLPEQISAEVLRKLRLDAEASFNEPVTRAVITVPAYFNDAQRNATKRAGELAGFTVERIINEPTAAALAYGLDRLKENSKIAVYDLGGGTFDLSILELNQGVFQVLSTNGNTRLGGDDLDRLVVDFLAAQIKEAGGPVVYNDPLMLARVRECAEKTKIDLSTLEEADVSLPFLSPGFSFQARMTRARLEDLARPVIARTRAHCLRALADAKMEANQLDQVVLVGGQTRMPLVRRTVAEIFGCAEFEETRGDLRLGSDYHRASGPVLNTSQNPDEAVALGAAIQAEILSGGFKNLLLLDVTPLSLGIETFGGLMNVIIHRNSTIPVKAGELFTTAVDNQKDMLIHVLQGERERAADNWSLGRFTLDFERAPKGVPRIGVQFEIDASGILHVLARDTRTGAEKVVEIKSAVNVDDAAVQKMVEDSVENAFEDLAARRWIEASLRAKEAVAATHKALSTAGERLPAESRLAIDSALKAVETLLSRAGGGPAASDANSLQAANAALDQATMPLAEILMDEAVEKMLQKKGININSI